MKSIVLLAVLGLLAAVPALAQAQAVPPHVLVGTASVDGVAGDSSTPVIAWAGAERLGTAPISDGRYFLMVPQPEVKQPLTFTLGHYLTSQSIPWELGGATVLNLNASSARSLLVLALEPLGSNLERVFYFDAATQDWDFYDPRPQFVGTNSLTELVAGRVYWLDLSHAQTVVLNGEARQLEAGSNQLVW